MSVAEKVIIKSAPSTTLVDIELPENGEQFEFKAVQHSDKSVQYQDTFYQIRPKFKYAPLTFNEKRKERVISASLQNLIHEKVTAIFTRSEQVKVDGVTTEKGDKGSKSD